MKIFLSFSTEDKRIVNEIYESLKILGYKFFKFDKTSNPGSVWQSISDGIDDSDIFLLFVSWSSEQSKPVKQEFAIAKYRRKQDKNF